MQTALLPTDYMKTWVTLYINERCPKKAPDPKKMPQNEDTTTSSQAKTLIWKVKRAGWNLTVTVLTS